MKIVVNLQIEGLHRWAQAADVQPQVGFLANGHRHIFHIKATKEVTHNDRDVEIILFKRAIEKYIKDKYFETSSQVVDFRSMSCEMIASEIAEQFNLSSCEVLEDGENGAICERAQIAESSLPNFIGETQSVVDFGTNVRVVFICGYICAGKSSLAQTLAELDNKNGIRSRHIEVSAIVAQILNATDREVLQNSAELDDEIVRQLQRYIAQQQSETTLYVSGLRQPSIGRQFPDAEFWWMEVPKKFRLNRYLKRPSQKDKNPTTEAFEKAENRDFGLGIYRLATNILSLSDYKE